MDKEELERDWMTNNALLTFVGALLMGQVWQMSEGTFKIFFVFTVPNYSEFVVLAMICILFFMSIFLALAAFLQRVRRYAIRCRTSLSPILDTLVWVAFTLSWATAHSELPSDQWWSLGLLLGGVLFSFVFIPLRVFQSKSRRG